MFNNKYKLENDFLKKELEINRKSKETERQQDIDAILVLSGLASQNSSVSNEVKRKAETKISNLIDKI